MNGTAPLSWAGPIAGLVIAAAALHGATTAVTTPHTAPTGPPTIAVQRAAVTASSALAARPAAQPPPDLVNEKQVAAAPQGPAVERTSPLDALLKEVAPPRFELLRYRLEGVVFAALGALLLWWLLAAWPAEPVRRIAPLAAAVAVTHPSFAQAAGISPAGAIAAFGFLAALALYRLHAYARLSTPMYLTLLTAAGLLTQRLFEGALLVVGLLALSRFRRAGSSPSATPGGTAALDVGRPRPWTTRAVAAAALLYVFSQPVGSVIVQLRPQLNSSTLPVMGYPFTANLTSVGAALRASFGLDITAVRQAFDVRILGMLAVVFGGVALSLLAMRTWQRAAERVREAPPEDMPGGWLGAGRLAAAFGGAWMLGAATVMPAVRVLLGVQDLNALTAFDLRLGPWLALSGYLGLVLLAVRSGLWRHLLARAEAWADRLSDLDLAALAIAGYLTLMRTPHGFGGWSWPTAPVFVVLVSLALRQWLSPRAARRFELATLWTVLAVALVRLAGSVDPAVRTMLAPADVSQPPVNLGWATAVLAWAAAATLVGLAVQGARASRR